MDEDERVAQWIRRQRELDERNYPGLHAKLDAMKAQLWDGVAYDPGDGMMRRWEVMREKWRDEADR